MPYRDFIPRVAAARRKLLQNPTEALTRLALHYQLNCEYIRRRMISLDHELDLYRKGAPVCALEPLSYHRRQELGVTEGWFPGGKRVRCPWQELIFSVTTIRDSGLNEGDLYVSV